MKKPKQPSIETCPQYQIFQESLRDFEDDVRRAWKATAGKSEMEIALSTAVSDEIIDMDFSRGRLITALVLLSEELELAAINRAHRN